jgi:hypothetical protein
MKEKHRALLMLGLVSFLLPMGEFLIFKRSIEPWSMYMFVEVALTTYAVYWWYVLDRRERNFRTGAIQNIGVVLISVLALPIYFIRSRGWGRGALASLAMLAIFIVAGALGYAGEYLGRAIAS